MGIDEYIKENKYNLKHSELFGEIMMISFCILISCIFFAIISNQYRFLVLIIIFIMIWNIIFYGYDNFEYEIEIDDDLRLKYLNEYEEHLKIKKRLRKAKYN